MSNVTISFVETPVTVTVDMSKLTWGDLLAIQRATAGNTSEDQAAGLINDVLTRVTGEDVEKLPATAVSEVLKAVMARVQNSGQAEKN